MLISQASDAIMELSAKTVHAGFLFACQHNLTLVSKAPVISDTRAVLADTQARGHGGFAVKSPSRKTLFEQSGVYMIRHVSTYECYIGSSVNLYSRKTQHIGTMRRGINPCWRLQQAFDRDGLNVFEFIVLEFCDKDMLLEREQFYINTMNPAFNISPSAGSNRGIKYNETSVRKSAESRRGAKRTPEQKARMRAGRTYRSHSQTTREKMSQSQKNNRSCWKRVCQIDPITGEVIAVYESAREANARTGIAYSSISRVCTQSVIIRKNRGGQTQILKRAGGYEWRFCDE